MDKVGIRQLVDSGHQGRVINITLLLVLSICIAYAAACRSESSPPPKQLRLWSGSRHLICAEPSPEELAKRFLEFVASDEVNTLMRLRITRQEYCDILWPELPGSRVPNLTCIFAWDQATLRSDGGLQEVLAEHRRKNYEFVSLRVKTVEDYQTFRALKDPSLIIRDEKGVEREVRVFGSILELDGQYKLFSFVAD